MYREPIILHLSQYYIRLILSISLIVFFISYTSLQAEPKLEVRQTLEKTSVITGEEIRGSLFIKNSGDETLKIRGVSSSCGCTTLRLIKRHILPEEEVELRFVVDTRGKLGLIEKTITLHTNTADSPHTETVQFHALPSGMGGADTQAVFEPPCAACHLDSGVGKSGKALYESVCAMCHTDMKIHTKNPEALLTMIFSGNAHIGMPAFGEFLTKKQIHSLIQILSKK
jgi:hypothetical protein